MIKSVRKEEAENRVCADKETPSKAALFGEKLARNLALAGMLVLTVAAIHNAEWPSGPAVLTAVREMIDPAWDESLGKISFVSHLFPDTVAVFFESGLQADLTAPCFGTVTHSWTDAEPYIGYASSDLRVYAAADGQVMSVAHGLNDERIVRVRHENGLETLYYNLASVHVQEGDAVTASTCLGLRLPLEEAFMEVRRSGRAIDPSALVTPREDQP